MENKITKTETTAIANGFNFRNPDLNRASEKIALCIGTAEKLAFGICVVLADIDRTQCFKDDDFKSVADYAEKTFGYKKSSANNMLRVGKMYTNTDGNGSLLPHSTGKDFTVTQISEMLTLKPATLTAACAGGIITPDMTQKQIREIVKELNGKKTIEGEAKELATEKIEKKKAEPEKALEGLTDDGIKAYREFRRQIDKAMGEKWYNVVTLTFIREDGTKEEKTLKVEDWYGKSIETEIIEKMEKAGK